MHDYCSLCIPYFINFMFCAFFSLSPFSSSLCQQRQQRRRTQTSNHHQLSTTQQSKPNKNHPKSKPKSSQTKINTNPPTWSAAQTHTNPNQNQHKPTLTFPCCCRQLSLTATAGFPCCHRQILYRVWMLGLRLVPCLDRSSNGIDRQHVGIRILERSLE